MADYAFFSIWELEAPIEQVWETLDRPERYPEWWSYVADVRPVTAGDVQGIGAVNRTRWTTALPYSFVFETRTTRRERPRLLQLSAVGELEGRGRWELAEDDGVTTVRYDWRVRANLPLLNLLAPVARAAFAWNHAVIMRAGGEGLARRLDVRLVRNQSYTEETGSPVGPLLSVAGPIALVATIARWLARLR